MVTVADHIKVAVSETIKTVAEDAGVQKFVLAENIKRLVRDDRAGEQESSNASRWC